MLYLQTDVQTATGYTLQTVASVEYRLFKFDRLPDVSIGDFMIDPTGLTSGYKEIAYVGSEGVGYQHSFGSPSSTTDAIAVTFYRENPDVTASANEQDVARRFDMLSRYVGSKIDPATGLPQSVPVYKKLPLRVFDQGDRHTIAMEKLDEVLGLLRDDYNIRMPAVEGRLDEVEEDVDTLIRPPGRTVTRTTYFNQQLVYSAGSASEITPWKRINLSSLIPTNAKSILGFVQLKFSGDHQRVEFALSPEQPSNVSGRHDNAAKAVRLITLGVKDEESNDFTAVTSSHFYCPVSGGMDGGVWSGDRKVYLKGIVSVDGTYADEEPEFADISTSSAGVGLKIFVYGYQW